MERNPGAEDHGPGEGEEPQPERDPEAAQPLDEEAAWAEIVAAYGEAPKADDLAPAGEPGGDARTATRPGPGPGVPPDSDGEGDEGGTSVRSFTVYAAGSGPRDWPSRTDDEDGAENEDDEGHFVPPEPPPLPASDPTAKFAWLAVLGGPLLLIFAILFQLDMTWWMATLGVGGFLGGFATLVARMRDGRDEDDSDDPGRGAVV